MSVTAPLVPPADTATDRPAFTIRGAAFTVAVMHLATADLVTIERDLAAKVTRASELFRNAPVVLDLQQLAEVSLELWALLGVLRRHGLIPIAVRHGTAEQEAAALRAGLGVLRGGRTLGADAAAPAAAAPAPAVPAPAVPAAAVPRPGRIVTQPVRSGQRVVVTDGDLVILAAVSTGAEVLAAGNLHVYAPLRGRAMAGLLGDTSARIFTLDLQAELVAIAGVYRSFEEGLPDDVRGQPAQIALENDQLIITPLAPLAAPPTGDDAKRVRK